jgi:hypothetical protein
VDEQVELVEEAPRSSQRTVVALPDIVMSPPCWALMSVSFRATLPLMSSEFCQPAACRLSETTYFFSSS